MELIICFLFLFQESFYVNALDAVVSELQQKHIAVTNDGAVVAFLKQSDLAPAPHVHAQPHTTPSSTSSSTSTPTSSSAAAASPANAKQKKEEKKTNAESENASATKKKAYPKKEAANNAGADDIVPVLIQKQDRTHLYATTDLAALKEVCIFILI